MTRDQFGTHLNSTVQYNLKFNLKSSVRPHAETEVQTRKWAKPLACWPRQAQVHCSSGVSVNGGTLYQGLFLAWRKH